MPDFRQRLILFKPMRPGVSGYARLQSERGALLAQLNARGLDVDGVQAYWYGAGGEARLMGATRVNAHGEASLTAELPRDALAPERLQAVLLLSGGAKPAPLMIGLCVQQSAGSLLDAKNAALALCERLARAQQAQSVSGTPDQPASDSGAQPSAGPAAEPAPPPVRPAPQPQYALVKRPQSGKGSCRGKSFCRPSIRFPMWTPPGGPWGRRRRSAAGRRRRRRQRKRAGEEAACPPQPAGRGNRRAEHPAGGAPARSKALSSMPCPVPEGSPRVRIAGTDRLRDRRGRRGGAGSANGVHVRAPRRRRRTGCARSCGRAGLRRCAPTLTGAFPAACSTCRAGALSTRRRRAGRTACGWACSRWTGACGAWPMPTARKRRRRAAVPIARPEARTGIPIRCCGSGCERTRRRKKRSRRPMPGRRPQTVEKPLVLGRAAFLAPFGRSQRSRKMLRHKALGLCPKPRQGPEAPAPRTLSAT